MKLIHIIDNIVNIMNTNIMNTNNIPKKLENINVYVDPVWDDYEGCDDTHEYCTFISDKINEYVDNDNKDIPECLLERYIYVVCNDILCWTLDYVQNLKNLSYIFKNCTGDQVSPVKIMKTIKENMEIVEIFINNKNIDMNFFLKMPGTDELFIKYINKFITSNFDEEYIHYILSSAISKGFYKSVDKILDMKIGLNNADLFNNIIYGIVNKSYIDPLQIIKKCINNGAKIEKNTLQIFIDKVDSSELAKYQFVNFKILVPFLYANGSPVNITELLKLQHKIPMGDLGNTINNINNHKLIDFTLDEFNELCDCGIKLTNYNNVKKYFTDKQIKSKIYINKLSYPIEVKCDLDILRTMCKTNSSISEIRKVLKSVTPDQECIENACETMNNTLIRLLREKHNLLITEKCILNYAKAVAVDNKVLRYIVDEYEGKNLDDIDTNED